MASKRKGYTVQRYIGGTGYPVYVCPPGKVANTKAAKGTNPYRTYNVNSKQPGTLAQPGENVDYIA